jgi:hypothetical protein
VVSQDELTYMSEFSKDVRLPFNHLVACIKLGFDDLDCEEISSRPVKAFINCCKCSVSESDKGMSIGPSTRTSSRTP